MELKCVFGTMECVFNVLSRAQQSRAEHGREERTGAEQRRAHTPVQLVVCASNNTCINPLTAYGLVVVHPQSTRPPVHSLVQRYPYSCSLADTYGTVLSRAATATVFFLRQRQRQCARLNSYLLFLSRLRGEIFRVSFVLFCVVLWKIHLSKQAQARKTLAAALKRQQEQQ